MAWIATSLLTAEAAVNVAVSPSADAIGQLNNDALDAAAFEAIRDDNLEAAENAFAEIISRLEDALLRSGSARLQFENGISGLPRRHLRTR